MKRDKERSDALPGDVLGIAHVVGPVRNPDTEIAYRMPSASGRARRRRRMEEGADELVPSTESTEPHHGSGAAGVDMGAGGEGTDIE